MFAFGRDSGHTSAMRFFNTAGPVVVGKHYQIPLLERVDLDGILDLIWQEKYFILHAPRQTGKTSMLLALAELLNAGDEYRCVYASIEAAQAFGENVPAAVETILAAMSNRAAAMLDDPAVLAGWRGIFEREYALGRRRVDLLVRWPLDDNGAERRVVIECKVRRDPASMESVIARGLEQARGYMDRCGATEGHLVVFESDENKPWSERLFRREEAAEGANLVVWGA